MSESILEQLDAVIESRRGESGRDSYVASLLQGDEAKALKKIGEEAIELAVACSEGETGAITHEAADLLFHTIVVLARHGLSSADLMGELERRFGTSGHAEKAARRGAGQDG